MAQVTMQMIDTMMAGNLSAGDLAAVAVGVNIVIIPLLFAFGMLMAVNPIVSQLDGAGETKEIGREVRQALWLSQAMAWPSVLLCHHLDPLVYLIGIEEEIIPKTIGYMKAFSWCFPPALAFVTLRFYCEGLGKTWPGLSVSLVGLPFNVLGNYAFMYGNFGFPEMGAVGTGWATTLVQSVLFLVMLGYCIWNPEFKKYGVFETFRLPKWEYLRELLRIGVPNGLSFLLEVSAFALSAIMIGTLGALPVAAHQVALNVASFTFMIPFGLSTAITIRVGNAIGRRRPDQARFSGFTGTLVAGIVMCFTGILMYSFPFQIIGLYTSDSQVLQMAVILLQMAAVFQISDGVQVAGIGALRGLKDTRVPMFVNFFAYWIVGLGSGSYLGLMAGWGAQGFWVGFILGLSTAAVLHHIRFRILSRRFTSISNSQISY